MCRLSAGHQRTKRIRSATSRVVERTRRGAQVLGPGVGILLQVVLVPGQDRGHVAARLLEPGQREGTIAVVPDVVGTAVVRTQADEHRPEASDLLLDVPGAAVHVGIGHEPLVAGRVVGTLGHRQSQSTTGRGHELHQTQGPGVRQRARVHPGFDPDDGLDQLERHAVLDGLARDQVVPHVVARGEVVLPDRDLEGDVLTRDRVRALDRDVRDRDLALGRALGDHQCTALAAAPVDLGGIVIIAVVSRILRSSHDRRAHDCCDQHCVHEQAEKLCGSPHCLTPLEDTKTSPAGCWI